MNIIQTQRSSGRIFGVVLRSDEIEMLGDKQASRVSHVLARVTHNTNLPRLRNRIRPEGVQQLALRRRLEKRRAESSKDPVALEQETNALWQEIELLEENNRRIQQDYDMAEMARMELEDQNQELESKLRNLQYKTNALESRSSAVNDTSMDSEYFVAFAARPDQPSTEECLELISRAFPNRCEILDTAWKSARDMSTFQSGRRLLDMLRRLMTEYIDAIQEGGDNHARLVFSADEYSAQESETVMNNHALSEKRKFVRKGQTLEMFRHLKIGKADNVSHTLRVHFAWLPDERKIVIGHCGEHLPISSH